LVNAFPTFANDGVKECERVYEDSKRIGSRLFSLNYKIIITKRNQDGARSLFSSIQSGLGWRNVCLPLPTNLVEKNGVRFQECLMVEHCPYCGL
jgi:hypothetical protein